jgi:hypothetical protein
MFAFFLLKLDVDDPVRLVFHLPFVELQRAESRTQRLQSNGKDDEGLAGKGCGACEDRAFLPARNIEGDGTGLTSDSPFVPEVSALICIFFL